MRFWDSSALVPLVVEEEASPRLRELYASDPELVVWWATPLECASAIARRERAGTIALAAANQAYARLARVSERWLECGPSETLRRTALRLLRTHDLRAADALQLAAARVSVEERPGSTPFVTLDERLAVAASREGFPVLGLP